MSHGPDLPYCRNCHYTLATPRPTYCGHCGQETDLHPPSVREMVTEYVGHYVAFDGPLLRTLWALIALPGRLTEAYFHGARRRYVLPLRVYLSASFLFFVGSLLLPRTIEIPGEAGPALQIQVGAAASAASAPGAEPAPGARAELGCEDTAAGACAGTERALNRLMDKSKDLSTEQWKTKLRALAPYGMLGMQPLFAALLLAMFAGSGRKYAEHFVFSLHSHSLWFLALLAANAGVPVPPLVTAVFVHGLVAMRRVYGLGWAGALWRAVLLSIGYLLLLALGLVALMALVAATA
jgi:hypothetical protein